MIIVMKKDVRPEQVEAVAQRVRSAGAEPHISKGQVRTVIGVIGNLDTVRQIPWEAVPGVARTMPVTRPLRFVSRDLQDESTVIEIGGHRIGGGTLTVIAGPCAVESRDQLLRAGEAVKAAGAHILRGDAFKPRTSPYAFQGLGEEGLELLAAVRETLEMPFVAEVLDPRDVDMVASYADIVRIGSRNMANFPLLREVGRQSRPVQLKRGFTATIEEWLNAAEYIFKEGNHQIILVERGIRTFETAARNTLDITAVPVVQSMSHLPVFVDPSHASGKRSLVAPLTRAAVAVGADGVMIDVHPEPESALVDGSQALLPEEFAELMDDVRRLAGVLERTL
ncbi:MAG: 3-deoxy-7-phosphoheptulonate synthase [Gammaproteobacteria bacterium]|nr:3-deoxy-7-phosphoheptulonate synthase [Gammaproteobacteria bacterium]